VNYGADFGVSTYPSALTDTLTRVSGAGGNHVRMWVHCDGATSPTWSGSSVSGLPSNFISQLTQYLTEAEARGVFITLSLFDFYITRSHTNVVTDLSILQSYIDNALVPILQACSGKKSLFAIEVFNEPEGMSTEFGWTGTTVSMSTIQTATNRVAAAVHAYPGILVTVGSWSPKAVTDNFGFMNYYTDARLVAAGGAATGTLDFYQIHYYSWMGHATLSVFDTIKSAYGLDRPVVVGEFSSSGSDGTAIGILYNKAFINDYDGAWGWQATGGGYNSDSFDTLLVGVALPLTYSTDSSSSSTGPHSSASTISSSMGSMFLIVGSMIAYLRVYA